MEPGQGYLFAVSWSTSRPLVFAVGTADGQVLLYDLKVMWSACACVCCVCGHVCVIATILSQLGMWLLISTDASGFIIQ